MKAGPIAACEDGPLLVADVSPRAQVCCAERLEGMKKVLGAVGLHVVEYVPVRVVGSA